MIIPARQAYAPGLEKIMFETIYAKIGPAGVVIAILAFISIYFFLASAIYLAWVPRGFRKFLAALKKEQPPVTEKEAREIPNSRTVWSVGSH